MFESCKCDQCGQYIHEYCCKCHKPLPEDYDDYLCGACRSTIIKKNLDKIMQRVDPFTNQKF
jgi:hypothetical protein